MTYNDTTETKELLRQQRRADYLRHKEAMRKKRAEVKERRAEAKRAERAERVSELQKMIKPAVKLDG